MKLNQKLIQQLRNGEIAVENNGTLVQLREVLKEAFLESIGPWGTGEIYFLDDEYEDLWDTSNTTHLPIKSISDFYQPELFTGWAKSDGYPNWMVYFKEDTAKFGFNVYGEFDDDYSNSIQYSLDEGDRPATHKEIESTLIKEAKRRGYKKWNYNCLELPRYTHDVADVFYYNEDENKLHHGKKGCATNVVFKNGQWAEIIEQPSQVKPKPKTNPIHYTVEGTKYSLNYQELKTKYESVVNYSDEQFMGNLPEIAHLACIVSYFKGLGSNATIGDKGIVHELIHLMVDPHEPTNDLAEIREKFNRLIELV